MRMFAGIVLLVVAQGLAACGSSASTSAPLAPSPVPQPTLPPTPTPPPPNDDAFIKGVVYDTANRALAGAIVEVVDGPQAGTQATSDATGGFSLTGTFDDTTQFRATKEGHVSATGTLRPSCAQCHPHRWIFFFLDVPTPPANIAGDFTLTFIADSACAAALPAEVRTRTYAATIAPTSYRPNTSFELTVSGAPFLSFYNSFSIGVAGDYLAFGLDNEGPVLVEQVAQNTYLGFDGSAEASAGTSAVSTISTFFDGVIDYCARKSAMGSYYNCDTSQAVAHARCESKHHQLILTRR